MIDVEKNEVVEGILVDTRPRRFALTPDAGELLVDIIDVATLSVVGAIRFLPTGFRPEEVTPVDVHITADGQRAFVALGRANHAPCRKTGVRAWPDPRREKLYLANGLSDDLTIIDTESLQATKSVPVGMVPYGILIDDH